MSAQKGTAVITGGSSGIGAEYARQLAGQGYDIVITGRREDKLKALCAEITGTYSVECNYRLAELSDPVELLALEKYLADLEHPAVLVNNAGFGTGKQFTDQSADDLESMIRVHDIASVRLTRAVLPGMMDRNQGAVIFVSSVASIFAGSTDPIYSASKVFLNYLAQSLNIAYCGNGIRFQSLLPGFTTSDFHHKMGQKEQYDSKYKFMSAHKVVEISLKKLNRNRVIVIPGLRNRILALLIRLIPNGLKTALLKRSMMKSNRADPVNS